MQCSRCQAENRESRRFCAECGAPLLAACLYCGFFNEPGIRFCGGCGVRLYRATEGDAEPVVRPPRPPGPVGDLRQVTILFADLSGFTELSSKLDPEGTHELLSRFYESADEVVERFGGTVDKHIGDNVMAVFGAPVAHDNDPERAVRAAVGIHEAMAELSQEMRLPLQVHIGVASGQVMASGTGSSRHHAYTVTGDSVNLASRLHQAARPGETLISHAVYHAVSNLVDGERVSDVTAKGLDRPVQVWRVREFVNRALVEIRPPFVGRKAELRQFASVLQSCRETGLSQAIYLRGEAGIGKTRLVEEFQYLAKLAGFACHTGVVLDFGVGKGQDAIGTIVRSLLGLGQGNNKSNRRLAVDKAISDGLIASDHLVFFTDLLDLPQSPELRATYDAMDNATRHSGKQSAVAALLKASALRQPILLTIEDLHWADALTIEYVTALTRGLENCPIVMVVTSRIEGDPLYYTWRDASRGAAFMTIELPPLRNEEAIALASEFIDATDRFALSCIERADGNPLFLEQLLRNAEESEEQTIPASIQSLVLARMDRLPAGDKLALQAASVVGQRFSRDIVRHLIDSPGFDCQGLIEHYLVRQDGSDYLFAHALIREGVYSSILKAVKRDLHRRAATWFAGRDLILCAEHLDCADDQKAPGAYLEAAEAEASAYSFDRALHLADRGLALAQTQADRFALTCLKGDLQRHLGSTTESIGSFRKALEFAGDDSERRCRAWIGLAAGMRISDSYDEALAALDSAEAVATDLGLTPELARIHQLRGSLYFPLGNIVGCLEQHQKALDYARRARSPEDEANALGGLGDAHYAQGRLITAYEYFRRYFELCHEHGFGRMEVANLPMAAHIRHWLNELNGALDDSLAAIEAARRVGHHRAEVIGRRVAYGALLDMAKLDLAEEHLQAEATLIDRLGARRFEPWNLACRAVIEDARGHKGEAVQLLERAVAICRDTGIAFSGATVLGVLAVTTEDDQQRQQALAEGEEILRAGSVSHTHFRFYRNAIETALDHDDWEGAERYATALEDYTRAEPIPWTAFFIARARALAAFGSGQRGQALERELHRLKQEALRIGLMSAVPALDRALATG